jgi:hypothetical protein
MVSTCTFSYVMQEILTGDFASAGRGGSTVGVSFWGALCGLSLGGGGGGGRDAAISLRLLSSNGGGGGISSIVKAGGLPSCISDGLVKSPLARDKNICYHSCSKHNTS